MEKTLELFRADHAAVAQERDQLSLQVAALKNPRALPEDAVRGSPLFIATLASLQFYQKEHAAHAQQAAQMSAELVASVENQKLERERYRTWRQGFDRLMSESVNALKEELAAARHERDQLRAQADLKLGPSNKEKVVAEVRQLLQSTEARVTAVEQQLARAVAERDAALAQLAQHEATGTADATHWRTLLEAQVAEATVLQATMAAERRQHEQVSAQLKALEEKGREMGVLLAVWKKSGADKRELGQVREAEALLRQQNAELKAQLERAAPAAAVGASEAAAAAQRQAHWDAELRAVADRVGHEAAQRARAEQRVEALQRELQAKRDEAGALLGEMGNIVGAFEELQRQNERLMQDLGQKDDTQTQLALQRANSRQAEMLLREEKNQLLLKMSNLKKLTAAQKAQLAAQAEAMEAQDQAVAALRAECHATTEALDRERLSLKEAQRLLQELRLKSDEGAQQARDVAAQLDTALQGTRAAQGRVLALQAELQTQRKGVRLGGPKGDIVMEQLRQLRAGACCSVCTDRFKNTVLTTCFHCFCRECVDTLVTNRSRKCPRCGKGFDKNNVKAIYLDFEGDE